MSSAMTRTSSPTNWAGGLLNSAVPSAAVMILEVAIRVPPPSRISLYETSMGTLPRPGSPAAVPATTLPSNGDANSSKVFTGAAVLTLTKLSLESEALALFMVRSNFTSALSTSGERAATADSRYFIAAEK